MDTNPDQSTTPVYHRCTNCRRLYKDYKYLHSYCEECQVRKDSDLTHIRCEASSTPLSASDTVPAYGQVGMAVKFLIIAKNPPCLKGVGKVTVRVKFKTGDIITAKVIDNQNGYYTASFVPTQPGEVEVSTFRDEKRIEKYSSTVLIHQYSSLSKPSQIIDDGGKVGQPWGIAFDKDGVWAITDQTNHCVYKFDSQDNMIMKVGSNDCRDGELRNPQGIAFDLDSNLYVTDFSDHRVQKFDTNGRYILQFGTLGLGDGQLQNPVGLTVYDDRVFVADAGNNRISVFQCDGEFSNHFGSDHLRLPHDVAVNLNQVLVADWNNHCISIFTIDGVYVNKIGFDTYGSARGQLGNPSSITTDLHGFILVSECYNHRVSIFNKDGVFTHCFGSSGSSAGQFSYPYGIACSPNGSVYICDHANRRIQIFSDF